MHLGSYAYVRIMQRTVTRTFPPATLSKRSCSSAPKVCVVGSGPSAFYTAQYLLRHHSSIRVDMFEKLPAPFGLVRYGVAPDHPEVKVVINTFTEVAKNPRFNFIGNVTIGSDIRLRELRDSYTALILAYGASVDRKLNIPGESLSGVVSARDFVGWYNGAPESTLFHPDLDCDTVAVIGMGNVAIDVARILLSCPERLKTTDIPEPVASVLSKSRVRRVVMVGRRGPLQAAFTLKELRELSRLNSGQVPVKFLPQSVMLDTIGTEEELEEMLPSLTRPRRRLIKFLSGLSNQNPGVSEGKECTFQFLRSPVRIIGSDNPGDCKPGKSAIKSVELVVNELTGPTSEIQQVRQQDDAPIESMECGLVVRSVGFRSIQIDPDLPFDEERGLIKSKDVHGRVADSAPDTTTETACPMYCSGWAKRGATGMIVDTAVDAHDVAKTVLLDLAKAQIKADPRVVDKDGLEAILEVLRDRGIRFITFPDWERVDSLEKLAGKTLGKPREKFTSIDAMLKAAFSEISAFKSNKL